MESSRLAQESFEDISLRFQREAEEEWARLNACVLNEEVWINTIIYFKWKELVGKN